MFLYNFQLALKSIKERPSLTILTILVIALGLGLYTTVETMAYQGGKIPLAHKSDNIFLIQLDNRELNAPEVDRWSRMVDVTYKDAINLKAMNVPEVTQTFVWSTEGILNVEDPNITPIRTAAAVTTHEFFTMFEPKFLYGTGWDKTAEQGGEGVIVISKRMNDQLFGGINSVGQNVRINTSVMRVVGVLDTWQLENRFYDRSFGTAFPDDFYVPYTFALNQDLPRRSRFDCWADDASIARSFTNENKDRLLNSECGWITYWAEIPDEQVDAYKTQLINYVESQKAFGRFPREIETYVTDLTSAVIYISSRNNFINMFKILSVLFFAVCLLNAVGILLAKFMRRTKEVSLRRALGAKKKTIIAQYIIEVVLIGIIGGAVGIIVAYFGLEGMLNIRLYASDYRLKVEDLAPYFQLDWTMIGNAFMTSVVCTLVISIYPIWRLCSVPPASQLKSQ
ncbi:ABC transporter permease [Thalassotalea ganghwensis]